MAYMLYFWKAAIYFKASLETELVFIFSSKSYNCGKLQLAAFQLFCEDELPKIKRYKYVIHTTVCSDF